MKSSRRLVVRLVVGFILAVSPLLLSAKTSGEDTFYIFGFVNNPGAYALDPEGTTVGDAIDLAGGFTASRHVSGVEIVRLVDGQKQTFDVKLNDDVRPNDTILVK